MTDPTTPAAGAAEHDTLQVAIEAYIYLYPLVMMDATRRQMTNSEAGTRVGFGPMNAFSHMRALPPIEFRAVPWASTDTLYSLAWLDLTGEPVILTVPDTAGRYYLMPLQDMWTDVFAVPGKRTSGTRAGSFTVVPPSWHGDSPAELPRIESPTRFVWIIGRTQVNGPEDYPAVNRAQDGFTLTPLSQWAREPQPRQVDTDPTVDMTTLPATQVSRLSGTEYFGYASELLKLHRPHITDWSVLERMRRLGLRPGKSFDVDALDPATRDAVDQAAVAGHRVIEAKIPNLAPLINGWQVSTETMGVYGNHYLKRAALAMIGLGSNPPEDAIYPLAFIDADGQPLNGENDYLLHFDQHELPPVNAFWSLTLYDRDGFAVPNPLNRRALGDRDPIRYNNDGSLDLYIQTENPGPLNEPNWLPAPRAPLALFLRLYEPKAPVLDGRWTPPAVKPVQQG